MLRFKFLTPRLVNVAMCRDTFVLPSMRPARRMLYRGMADTFFGDDENAQVGIMARSIC